MLTEECRRALDRLAVYLEHPSQHPSEWETTLHHLRSCPHCRASVVHLNRAYTTDADDQLTCEECQERLPEYLAAFVSEQAAGGNWHSVALHLALCPYCSELFDELLHLSEIAERAPDQKRPRDVTPRLAFLESPSNVSPSVAPWRRDELGRLIIAFSAELIRALQAAAQPAPAAAGVKSAAPVVLQLDTADATGDLEVSISAEPARDAPARYTIVVDVRVLNRGGWPNLGGSIVTLMYDDQTIGMRTTDAYGTAVFEHIETADLARMVAVIQPLS
jgi:hypothetical protein